MNLMHFLVLLQD